MQHLPGPVQAALKAALDYSPKRTYLQENSPCPSLTHPLSFYDTHLDRRLSLKQVKCIPSFAANLSHAVDIALEKASQHKVGLPRVLIGFPKPGTYKPANILAAKDAADVGDRYREMISIFACKLAGMLALHPSAAEWSVSFHMSKRITSPYQKLYALIEDYVPEFFDPYEPIPGEESRMISKEAWDVLSDDDRKIIEEMRQRFPRMAVWQMYFPTRKTEDSLQSIDHLAKLDAFPEVVNLTRLDGLDTVDVPLSPSPDAFNTAWNTSVSSWIGASDIADTSLTSPILSPKPSRRSLRERPTKNAARKGKQRASGDNGAADLHWPTVTLPQKRDMKAIDPDMTTSIVQHAWCRATERDSSFIIFHCGTFERIAFRHRASGTLFVSDLFEVAKCKDPAYAPIQIGLMIAIFEDIRDRTRQLVTKEAEEKPKKRKRKDFPDQSNKRPRTRASTALERLRKLQYETNFKAVCEGLVDRDLGLLRIQHGPYNSPAPSSFLRVGTGATSSKTIYEPHEYFRITITSAIAWGKTGEAHSATIDLEQDGKVTSFPHAVVKLAFSTVQKKRLRHEFTVYSHMMTHDVRGIPHMFGLFEDVETQTLALVMENAGESLSICRLPDKRNRYGLTVSESEKTGFMEVLKSIHAVGVRHRDLRIDNLTINRDGDPYIIDFDRAALEADEESQERERHNLNFTLKGYGEPCLSRETPEPGDEIY